jgi:fructuronate reductase
VRIVHIGLGAFHRAHQAWYTAKAVDAAEWGIAAFTGRSATAAQQLAPQGGLYCLVERSDAGEIASIIPSLSEVVDGSELHRFVELVTAETTAIVTITITEPGYRLVGDGIPDEADELLAADVTWLAAAFAREDLPEATAGDGPATSLGRLLLGLEARRRAGGGPIAIVPCDNMPDNGPFVRRGMLALARSTSRSLADWIGEVVSFVSTSVDRITPKTVEQDKAIVAELTGWDDASPVITEPFSDWVLSGAFPAGRPAWETAGARFVDDIEPFERRKLWLLNGSHSLLAYAGTLRGYATVAEAVADPTLRSWVEELWDEASRHLPEAELDLPSYRRDLLTRFGNSRIEHRLAQIGMEGVSKLRVRAAAIARAERSAGRPATASARAIAAWAALVVSGASLPDAHADSVSEVLSGPADDIAPRLIHLLDPELAADASFVATVEREIAALA